MAAMDTYDVAVIGGGPGGYVAAIRAGQLGLKTACIEKWPAAGSGVVYGGTCLNVGCIPSKALLESSHRFEEAGGAGFAAHGVKVSGLKLDLGAMQKRKEKIVGELTGGIRLLLKKNKVDAIAGCARLAKIGDQCEIEVDGKRIAAGNVIIATGSVSRPIAAAPVDNKMIVDNVGALEFSEVPKRLCVIGAGVIGLELGSVWRRLGSEVVILEALPDFLAAADAAIAKAALREFTRQGLKISMGCTVEKAEVAGKKVKVSWNDGGRSHSDSFDRLIVAVGRIPCTEGLGAAEAGLQVDSAGRIAVDEHCRTAHANVYAIGDVVRGPMLAHKAEEEGVMVAELIAGGKPEVEYGCIPWVIYTHPEIAWVGRTERQLKEDGVDCRAGSFPFIANGRAKGIGDTVGMVKILAERESDRVVGVHILGGTASDMIAEAVLAMEFGASAEDIARTCHAHPTLSEAVKEAALAVDARAIHG